MDREQAIDRMASCSFRSKAAVVSEVERYIVNPGQACSYMVGRMRDEAKAALGDKFDIRDFHEVVLRSGAIPLTLLRREVERWYKSEARA